MNPRSNRSSIRVAIVSDAAPERNGVGTYYRDLAEHLAPRVEAVTMICPNTADAVKHWVGFPLPGDTTQRLGVPSPMALDRRLRALRPHVVIIATPGPYGLIGARYARRHADRLIYGLHTHYEALSGLYWGTMLGGINRWYLSTVNRRLARQADFVVANAPGMCDLGGTMGARAVHLVGTPLPAQFMATPTAPPRRNVESVLFVGRLAAEKRVDSLIEAARALPEMLFTIAGEGPERPAVEAAAAVLPNVEYLGWLDRVGVRDAIDACDVLALPSQVEAFGTVALESLARGRTTLVSAGCGISDWPELDRGLDRLAQGESLAAAIQRIAGQDPEQRMQRARIARCAVAGMVRDALDHWLELLGAPGVTKQSTVA